MRRTTRTRFSWVSLVLIVVFLMASLPASAQEAGWQGPVRIDVVAVALASDGRLLEIRHYRDAV